MNNTNSQLIHAAVELVIGACITFWLNRKISTVTQKVGHLEDKIKYYENTLIQHHELIKKLFSIIETISPEMVSMTKPPSDSFKNPKTASIIKTDFNNGNPSLTTQLHDAPNEGDKENAAAELDAILSSEIKDIQVDRTASLT